MSINPKCPNCGSKDVQLTTEMSKHSVLWFVLFGWLWLLWWLFKAMIALYVLILFDWWYAIIKKSQNKGYVWISKRIMQNRSKTYHCNKCKKNFRG